MMKVKVLNGSKSAEADAMPRVAIRATKVDHIMLLTKIGQLLCEIMEEKSGGKSGD